MIEKQELTAGSYINGLKKDFGLNLSPRHFADSTAYANTWNAKTNHIKRLQ